ncbi:uncharacterized protein LY79DRAFT_521650 [Colletotrichum navitas]|uniref:Uncharacterized protein n=1 Tax=Colletotrichum navitas TaxID=681940 RepID=A0AAD8PTM7_9PEZI|nr:uncharacterized protein LY79DRAFT_521650 [Colletotrichum navitas]KAK1579990.1 hypothetical protein LY79DRAFT_521650 [Colletotrichum navitas]
MATTRDVSRQVPTARRDRLQQFGSQEWQGIEVKVLFIFNSPDGGKAEGDGIKWEAFLLFKARDLPRLMREGFHWNAANLDREAGYMERRLLSDDRFNDEDRWSCSRTFFLSDLSDDPQWAAKLIVYPEKVTVLSSFTITNINMDTMNGAAACKKVADQDRATQWVYFWHRNYLEDNFNAIYDDMPLTGWWPWPRQEVDDDDITLMDVANEWRETWIPGQTGSFYRHSWKIQYRSYQFGRRGTSLEPLFIVTCPTQPCRATHPAQQQIECSRILVNMTWMSSVTTIKSTVTSK